MNLLNSVFNFDNMEIIKINKKYSVITIVVVLILTILLIIKKDIYYRGTYNVFEKEVVIVVESEYINKIKDVRKIKVNSIWCDYSINEIDKLDNLFLVNISLNTEVKINSSGIYELNLGKERLLDYIVRIIKK